MLMRSVALCLLTSAWIFLFSGCPYEPEQEQDMTGCSYVAEAYHGYFTPNKADNIYELYLDQTLPDVTWHLPYPFTGAGAVSWDTFARSIWPKYLAGMRPIGAIACRLEDGAWTTLAAQFLNVALRDGGKVVCSVKLTQAPPREMLTGVAVYLDNQGDTSLAPLNTGAFLLGADAARFDATETANRYEVTLNVTTPEILTIMAAPELVAGPQLLDFFVRNLWPDIYADVMPHATFCVETEDGTQQTVVAALSEPAWDEASGTLRFSADILEGAADGLAGAASLYLDNGWWKAEDFGGSEFGDWTLDARYRVVYILRGTEVSYSMAPVDIPLIEGYKITGFYGSYYECLGELNRLQRLDDCAASGCTHCTEWNDCLD